MPKDIGYGVPETYDYINMYNSSFSPSTVHVKNTALQRFFRRYLFQKAISVFKWDLPKTWNRDYFLYVLYSWGFIGVVETNKYGVICQAGVPYGYDIYYNKTNYEIAYTLEYLEDKVIVVVMAGTRENFYDQLKQYMRNM